MRIISYIKARLNERSTWAAIGAGATGAAALNAPWSYVAMVVAVIGTLVPTSTETDNG